MSHLTHRAEQALLGAFLALPEPPPELLATLRSDDFGHRGHQQVFAAVLELQEQQPWLKDDQRLAAVADRVKSPGADRQWLEQLRDRAARPDHLGAYTQMVQVAALRRDVAVHADRIAGNQVLPDLAHALLRQSQAYEQLTAEHPDAAVPDRFVALAETTSRDVDDWMRSPDGRTIREDWLLADLLQHPEQAPDLARILPDEALTTAQRREVYRVLVNLGETGDPVDEVIVAWQLENQRSLEELYQRDLTPTFERIRSSDEPDVVYLTRLAATTTPATATEIGRGLIADDLRAQLAGIGKEPRPNGVPQPDSTQPRTDAVSPIPLDPSRHRPPPPPDPGANPRPQP